MFGEEASLAQYLRELLLVFASNSTYRARMLRSMEETNWPYRLLIMKSQLQHVNIVSRWPLSIISFIERLYYVPCIYRLSILFLYEKNMK